MIPSRRQRGIRTELALVFLKLGFTAFGGPAAHIAIFEREIVRRRRWLPLQEFLDLLGATNLIPGPNSTEMAIHIGRRQAGWQGLLIAGASFILPSSLMVLGLAWLCVRYGHLPETEAVFYGMKPVLIAIILQALWRLAKIAIKDVPLAFVTLAATALSAIGVNELAVLFGTGGLMMAAAGLRPSKGAEHDGSAALAALFKAGAGPGVASAASAFGILPLFLFFLKVGSVLFGSGYVLLAFLRADLVERYHWLTEEQLLEAIAVGQITPGPLFASATFVGFLLGGFSGAGAATAGIFLPAFVFVAISAPFVPRLRASPVAAAFLDGVNAASLALMAVVTWQLARAAIVDAPTALMALAAAVLLFLRDWNSAWLILAGAAVGWFIRLARF